MFAPHFPITGPAGGPLRQLAGILIRDRQGTTALEVALAKLYTLCKLAGQLPPATDPLSPEALLVRPSHVQHGTVVGLPVSVGLGIRLDNLWGSRQWCCDVLGSCAASNPVVALLR